MNIKESKLNQVITKLSNYFIYTQVGDKIPSVQEFSEEFEVGRGTVQAAMKHLVESNTINYVSQGRNGSYVTLINYEELLKVTHKGYIVGMMPIPRSKIFEGLATGVLNCFKLADIDMYFTFMTGSENRIRALLKNKCDFVIISKYAYQEINKDRSIARHIMKALSLGKNSFIDSHVVIRKKGKKQKGVLRVGYDFSSKDQIDITNYYYRNRKIEKIPLNYSSVTSLFNHDKIDEIIWSADNIILENDYLESKIIEGFTRNKSETEAVIIVRSNDSLVKKALELYVDGKCVKEIQKKVCDELLPPKY